MRKVMGLVTLLAESVQDAQPKEDGRGPSEGWHHGGQP
jgi:hypothetical protein